MRDKNEYFDNPDLLFIDIADAIREKTGEVGLIDAVDYPEKIQDIEGITVDAIDYKNEIANSAGWYAYYGMNTLKSVDIPNLYNINSYAFAECRNLKSVTFLNNLNYIDDHAFYNCVSLESIADIPDTTTSIGDSAFEGCSSLASVTIGKSVSEIGVNVFKGCTSLRDIIVSEDNFYYRALEGALIHNATSTILKYATARIEESYSVPDDIVNIDSHAFSDCSVLKSITLPLSIENIKDNAFSNCGLSDVYYYGNEESWSGVTIGEGNDDLLNANIHYMYDSTTPVYKITYDLNGVSGSINPKYAIEGTTITLTLEIPRNPGFTFIGWATSADATGAEYVRGDEYTVNGDITLYAVWRESVIVYQAPATTNYAIISVPGEIVNIRFTPTQSGTYTLRSTLSDGDSYCYLYDSNFNQLAYDDDGAGNGNNFKLTYYMEAGVTYYYGVKYWNANITGTIPIELTAEF